MHVKEMCFRKDRPYKEVLLYLKVDVKFNFKVKENVHRMTFWLLAGEMDQFHPYMRMCELRLTLQ